ncbi:protein hesA, partial [Paenibacillus riograndensis]
SRGVGGRVARSVGGAGVVKLTLREAGVVGQPELNRRSRMGQDHLRKARMSTELAQRKRLNPDIELAGHNARSEIPLARPWVQDADIVIDARYDFPERYALNRLCVDTGTPMVEAAMYGFEISLTTVIPGVTPCLECLYPDVQPQWEPLGFPVLGATSGIAGCLAALEAVKWITGVGTTYAGVMHRFSSLDFACYSVHISRNPKCACCGEGGTP